MRAVAHSPDFAYKTGIPQEVGREFYSADKLSHQKRLAHNVRKMNKIRA